VKFIEKIVIASRNPAKKQRFAGIFAGKVGQVLGLEDFNIAEKPQEAGESAEENARIKAKFYSEKLGLPAFSEDEALYVDFLPLDTQPGVFVRRIEGKEEADDEKLLNYWEKIIASVPLEKRTGKWHIAYCLAFPNGQVKTAVLDHPIMFFSPSSKTRVPGWPLSSLQGPVMFKKPDSELTDSERKEKNQRANKLILEKLEELLSV
jgi:inosine/xanthosine triphosphate pyrophosphatase family protein